MTDRPRHDATRAQAELDALRHQTGEALSGDELRARRGQVEPGLPDPPLDTRLTARNVILQALALILFGAVVWFLAGSFLGGIGALVGS